MGIFESKYSQGRYAEASYRQESTSMLPNAEDAAKLKPEVARKSRPLEPLSQRSMQVLATLPRSYQMHETRKIYPHVMNRIADAWHDPEFFFHVMRNLLLDQRGGRSGFQFSVLAEVTNLREYYFSNVRPESQDKFNRDM
jgi:hypothetical protein